MVLLGIVSAYFFIYLKSDDNKMIIDINEL